MSADELLALAASVERFSEHPLAQAIVLAARDKNLPFKEVHDFVNLAGKGVQARIGDATVMVGKYPAVAGVWCAAYPQLRHDRSTRGRWK